MLGISKGQFSYHSEYRPYAGGYYCILTVRFDEGPL
jgi:hypothetical protein